MATDTSTGETHRFTTNFLWMCQGYYRHAQGYTPEWPGMDRFQGPIVHPQTWPEDLDYRGKQVIVIGSGATTATLVPAIAAAAKHITVIQRSPTYFWTGPNSNELADILRELDIDETWIHEIVRRKVLHDQEAITRLSFEQPDLLRDELLNGIKAHLPADYPVEEHFAPSYRPWQQRLAFVPDGDLFEGIKAGKASMVTDEIDTFTEHGILLKSGREVTGDIVVTATGFDLSVLGDIQFTIDGEPLAFHDTVTYRGMMFTGIPNMVLGVRLLPGQLDAARRPDRRLHVPAAPPHGRPRRAAGHAAAAARGRRHADPQLDRPGELQPELPDAQPAPAPAARRQAGVDAHPGLLDREGRAPRRRPRRRLPALRVGAPWAREGSRATARAGSATWRDRSLRSAGRSALQRLRLGDLIALVPKDLATVPRPVHRPASRSTG